MHYQPNRKTELVRAAKYMVRHLVAETGLMDLNLRLRSHIGQDVRHLYPKSLQDRFSTIYRNRYWLVPHGKSLSGAGSDLENTSVVVQALPKILAEIGANTLVDVGCGDFGWMKEIPLPCKYVGVDIVPDLIDSDAATYGSAQVSFQTLDATTEPLPQADTALCREVLFHLSLDDVWRVIENLHRSNISYLIATNETALMFNPNILSGDFRSLNLSIAPFNFPEPILSIPDDALFPDRVLAVWKISSLPRRKMREK
jgi:hypothetical protein